MTNKGRLIVFSAPSGCGKGTMLAEILKDKNFYCSVSATTRSPREGEIDGVNYYFLKKEDFESKIQNNEFLEYACYCDNYYGTLVSEVENKLNEGINVILEIEVQGAMKIRKIRPDALFIFISPPSVEELRRRLRKRGTESEEIIEKRVAQAERELSCASEYDYDIVNDALEDAVSDFFAVIRAEQLKVSKG
ncbi:MAG: guanylate kinase [Ruminococcus flavefaciens]|nr:guanylate kinase [Ruminococcus flavefaciens]MCM1229016.1 guanylate kinase [Ruminococcus flavefaciens]